MKKKIHTMLRVFLLAVTLSALCSISVAAEEVSYVKNGSFEEAWETKADGTSTGWSNGLDGGRTIVEDADAPDGVKVLQMAADPEQEIINLSYSVFLESGTKYRLHYWVKSTGTEAQTSGVTVKRKTTEYVNGAYQKTEVAVGGYDVAGTDGVWKKQTITVNPHLDAQGEYTFIFRNYLPESGVTVCYDKIELIKSEIDNGSFEEAYVTTNTSSNGWRTALDDNRVIDTQGYDGDHSLKLISTGSASGWTAHEYDRYVEPGVKYTLSFYVKVSGKGLVTGVRCSDYGLPTKYLFNDFAVEDTNGLWVKKYITFTVPADGSGLYKYNFHFRVSNEADNVAWYDDIRLYKSHIDNGSFENAYANSGDPRNGWRTNLTEGKTELDNTTAADGTTSAKVIGNSPYMEYNYYLETNQKYRMTYWVKSTGTANATSYLQIQYNNGAWTRLKDYFVTGTNDVWTKQVVEFVTPASETDATQRYLFDFRCRYADATVWYDGIILEKINDDILLSYEDVFASVAENSGSYTLPATTPRGYKVVWSSNSPALTVDGYTATPVRDPQNDQTVVLTATITIDEALEYTKTRDFTAVVHADKLYARFTIDEGVSQKKLLSCIASYKDNRLTEVYMETVNIGETIKEITLPPSVANHKAFLWDKENMMPISEDSYTVEFDNMSVADSKATLYQLVPQNSDGTYDVDVLMMGYVIKTANGKIIVIDGGLQKPGHIASTEAEGFLFKQLQEITGQENPVIDAWIFSHCHSDHVDEFVRMVTNHLGEFTVNNFYYNMRASQEAGMCKDNAATYEGFKAAYNTYMGSETAFDEYTAPVRGDSFTLDDVQVNFIYHPDPASKIDGTNNANLVFTVTVEGQKILFLGDLGENGGCNFLTTCTAEEIKSDIVQMAHHGQNGVLKDVYEITEAKVALWPAPIWLWTAPYGSYKTEEVRWWMNDLGIRKNIVAGVEGLYVMPLPYAFDWRL